MRLRGGGDDSKPDVPPTADDKEAGDVRGTGSEAGDDQDASSRANIDKEALNERVLDKETSVWKDDDREPNSMTEDRKASSTTEDAKEASDVKETGCEAEDEKDANSRADDRLRQDQSQLVGWSEQKKSRKIHTTSLLLKRKKNRQTYKHKDTMLKHAHETLRLRGGGGDDNGGGINPNQDEPCTTDNQEESSRVGGSPQEKRKRSKENDRKKHDKINEGGEKSYSETNIASALLVNGGLFQGPTDENPRGENLSQFAKEMNWQCVGRLARPDSWGHWEQDRQMLRPPPLDSPRSPDLAYLNMTVDEAANEDGIEHYSLAKDGYRRTDAQVQAVREAQRDQKRVAGGIYQCQEDGKESFYLHVMKGAGKLLGIKLVHSDHHQKPRVQFETFAKMEYEKYVQCSSQRIRVNLPEETETGFVWYGHGGNTHPLSSSVYKFSERVDNDIHYSASDCDRVTQAPGASQLMCSNKSCGVIFWHLSVMFFHRKRANHFEEAGQEHFAVMMLKTEEQVLLWTDKDGNQTRWTRLEHSLRYEKVHVVPGSVDRIRYVVAEGLLPQCNFSLPAYSPILKAWSEPQPLNRISSTCKW